MDPELAGIFTFVLVAAMLTFAFAALMQRRTATHEERKLELQARIEEAKAQQAALPNETQQHLEDRMRVLERIVTDPSTDLSRQIENLRELSNEGEAAR